MGKMAYALIVLCTVALFFIPAAASAAPIKVAIFNFQSSKIELSIQGTTITNMLSSSLTAEPGLSVLDRKELENFLELNDLQQKSSLDAVIDIGARLELKAIVLGTLEKRGAVLTVNARVVSIEQKRVIFSKHSNTMTDIDLGNEIAALGKAIAKALTGMDSNTDLPAAFPGPVNLRVRSGNRQMVLNWDPPPNIKTTAYDVFRSVGKDVPFVKLAQVTKGRYQDRNLEKGVAGYYYKIKAYNEDGNPSEDSTVVYAEAVLLPNSPVILKVESHIKGIQITWAPHPISSGDPSKINGYKLYRAESEHGSYNEAANVPLTQEAEAAGASDNLFKHTFMDKVPDDGKGFFYKLTAYNEKKMESDYSPPVRGVALPPVGEIKIQGDLIREVNLSWAAFDSAYIGGYYIYRSVAENEGFKKIAKIEKAVVGSDKRIQYKDRDGLSDMVRYYYRITAFEAPELETSPAVTVSAMTRGKPPVPLDMKSVSGLVKKVELTWTPSVANEVEGYRIYGARKSEGEFVLLKKLAGRNQGKYVDEERGGAKLEDNATYYYRLTSYNRVELESSFSSAMASTKSRPAQPQGFKTEALRVKEAALVWQANAEADIASYHIWHSDHEQGEFREVAKVTAAVTYVAKDLSDGATYYYKLQAEDRDGLLSDFSPVLTVKTKAPPPSPAGLAGEIRNGIVYLKWERGSEPEIAHYRVYEKRLSDKEQIIDVQAPLFNEPAPPKGTSKTYVITAIDQDGRESEPSQEITLKRK